MKSPDFALPLLSRETYSTFSRKTDGTAQAGRVYPQVRGPSDARHHPEMFYVEWPAASEDFREIHAPTLAAITGYQATPHHPYTTNDVSRIISAMHTIPVPKLLHAARPQR